MAERCVCCGLDTVSRDYDRGGESCGTCGTIKHSEAWDALSRAVERLQELEANYEALHKLLDETVVSSVKRERELEELVQDLSEHVRDQLAMPDPTADECLMRASRLLEKKE